MIKKPQSDYLNMVIAGYKKERRFIWIFLHLRTLLGAVQLSCQYTQLIIHTIDLFERWFNVHHPYYYRCTSRLTQLETDLSVMAVKIKTVSSIISKMMVLLFYCTPTLHIIISSEYLLFGLNWWLCAGVNRQWWVLEN